MEINPSVKFMFVMKNCNSKILPYKYLVAKNIKLNVENEVA